MGVKILQNNAAPVGHVADTPQFGQWFLRGSSHTLNTGQQVTCAQKHSDYLHAHTIHPLVSYVYNTHQKQSGLFTCMHIIQPFSFRTPNRRNLVICV